MNSSVLESIAEVAIALAGFGGVAAGLGYRARGGWSNDDQLRLLLLAVTSLAVVFACFLPHVTQSLGCTAPWRAASTLWLLFPASTLIYTVWFFRRGLPAAYSRIAAWLAVGTQIIALGFLLPVAVGYAGPREFGFYLTATVITLFQASLFFIRLLATSFRSTESNGRTRGTSHVA